MSAPEKIIRKIKISCANGTSIAGSTTKVIQEVTLSVNVNEKPLADIACAGIHLKELAVGFLRSERIIAGHSDIENIRIIRNIANITLKNKKVFRKSSVKNIASSGARGKTNSISLTPLTVPADFTVKSVLALKLMDNLLNGSAVHNQTGGTHCSALAAGNKIVALREDIGRHNTIDMLGGYSLLKKINLSKALILTTGRISSEIVYKVWNMGVPVIISHSAPTANAVELSRRANILLIGYVRNGKMNIYSQERRVII
ncbi:MAG: formate dehydrogenase accessory sulfurtransferase FdhD [Smithella sp.]|jgi:FdhD protein